MTKKKKKKRTAYLPFENKKIIKFLKNKKNQQIKKIKILQKTKNLQIKFLSNFPFNMQTTSNSSLPFEHLYSHFLNLSDQHTLTHTPTESAETTSVFSQEENINNLNNSSFVHIKGKKKKKIDKGLIR